MPEFFKIPISSTKLKSVFLLKFYPIKHQRYLTICFKSGFYVDSDPVWINKIPKSELEILLNCFNLRRFMKTLQSIRLLYEVMQAINFVSKEPAEST